MYKVVICSHLKAIRYYFSEEALAFFQPQDSADLAKQMVRFYEDTQRRAGFARQGLEGYTQIRREVMRERYLNLTANLLEGKQEAHEAPQPEPVGTSA